MMESQQETFVTIGVAVYNGEKYLRQTLESLIQQSHRNFELLVSDNCSTDSTRDIVQEFIARDSRVRLNVNEENLGFSGNLNRILTLAKSELVALYHADDVYDSEIVARQIRAFSEHPTVAGCFTLASSIDALSNPVKNPFYFNKNRVQADRLVDLHHFVHNLATVGNMFVCPTAMLKRSVVLSLGGFDRNIKYCEDQDMWIRILEANEVFLVAEERIKYRLHAEQGNSYYLSRGRRGLAVDLIHFDEYLKRHSELDANFRPLFNKRLARDHIKLASNACFSGDYQAFVTELRIAKTLKFRGFDVRYWGYLLLDNRLGYALLRVLFLAGGSSK